MVGVWLLLLVIMCFGLNVFMCNYIVVELGLLL